MQAAPAFPETGLPEASACFANRGVLPEPGCKAVCLCLSRRNRLHFLPSLQAGSTANGKRNLSALHPALCRTAQDRNKDAAAGRFPLFMAGRTYGMRTLLPQFRCRPERNRRRQPETPAGPVPRYPALRYPALSSCRFSPVLHLPVSCPQNRFFTTPGNLS